MKNFKQYAVEPCLECLTKSSAECFLVTIELQEGNEAKVVIIEAKEQYEVLSSEIEMKTISIKEIYNATKKKEVSCCKEYKEINGREEALLEDVLGRTYFVNKILLGYKVEKIKN